jgi:hypothetical protein
MPFQKHIIHAFPKGFSRTSRAAEIRTTMLAESLANVRASGHYDAYLEELGPEHAVSLPISIIAPGWLPIEVAFCHYWALDRLTTLSKKDALVQGASFPSHIKPLALLARSVGATPWAALARLQGGYESAFRGGGGTRVTKVGPKEALVEIIGVPLAEVPYFRTAFRGFLVGAGQMFCNRLYASEITALCTSSTLAFRLAWA